ncbi:MAG: hypothetical protein JNL11_02435 [Bdellovibrionaceae bacterium]|nr:hypothetical protein [Pseudobdellovibrionaceae bacterium]
MENAQKKENNEYDRDAEIKFLVTQIIAERLFERNNKLKIVTSDETENQPEPIFFGF